MVCKLNREQEMMDVASKTINAIVDRTNRSDANIRRSMLGTGADGRQSWALSQTPLCLHPGSAT